MSRRLRLLQCGGVGVAQLGRLSDDRVQFVDRFDAERFEECVRGCVLAALASFRGNAVDDGLLFGAINGEFPWWSFAPDPAPIPPWRRRTGCARTLH